MRPERGSPKARSHFPALVVRKKLGPSCKKDTIKWNHFIPTTTQADEALEKSYRASLGALGVGWSMEHTGNLATVWGACATEKGRQFRQMSMDLSEFFPMIFCGDEERVTNGNVTGHKGRQGTPSPSSTWKKNTSLLLELWFKKSTNPETAGPQR